MNIYLPDNTQTLRPVYKPHSVQQQQVVAWAIISLGAVSPQRSLQPTRDWHLPGGRCTYGDEQPPAVHERLRPYLALLPAGVTWPRTLLRVPVVSYTTFSPLPPQGGSGLFLWPYPASLPRPGCYPTLCSTECGLSSTPTTRSRDRPTDLRCLHHNPIMNTSQLP